MRAAGVRRYHAAAIGMRELRVRVELQRIERKMSATLREVSAALPADRVRIGELLERVGEQGMLLFCMIATVPFLLPVSIPGTSLPFGLIILLVGAGVALNRVPYLPRWLLERGLPSERVARVFTSGAGLFERIERLVRPRLAALTQTLGVNRLNGCALGLAGLLLMAPLPIPLSNTVPAWAALLLALGIVERDGLALIGGYALLLLTALFFALLAYLGLEFMEQFLPLWGPSAAASQPA